MSFFGPNGGFLQDDTPGAFGFATAAVMVVGGTVPNVGYELTVYGDMYQSGAGNEFALQGALKPAGAIQHSGSTIGFFSATPASKQTVSGAKGGNAALGSLLTALVNYGLITDTTTA